MIMLAVVIFGACDSRKAEDQKEEDTSTAAPVSEVKTENQLSDAQKSEGWKLLFNGENTDGWEFYKDKENTSWEIVDGTLHCKADTTLKRADLRTVEQFENFELAFDWKIAPGHNSGVIYRSTEEFDEPYLSGPEYQVIDDKGYSGGKLKDTQLSGANYDMHAAASTKSVNPPGEWNSGRILVNGNHVEHWLNDSKVVEYELNSPEWKKLKAGSKWKNAKGYGVAKKGSIDLQDHGGEVWYRNIMIKTL